MIYNTKRRKFVECVEHVNVISTIANVYVPSIELIIPRGTMITCPCGSCKGEKSLPEDMYITYNLEIDVIVNFTVGTIDKVIHTKRPNTNFNCIIRETVGG